MLWDLHTGERTEQSSYTYLHPIALPSTPLKNQAAVLLRKTIMCILLVRYGMLAEACSEGLVREGPYLSKAVRTTAGPQLGSIGGQMF